MKILSKGRNGVWKKKDHKKDSSGFINWGNFLFLGEKPLC
jgi:hypothetical protein